MGDDEVVATSDGLMQCLRMLAEEASILHLDQTFAALKDALDTCHIEVSASRGESSFESPQPRLTIH